MTTVGLIQAVLMIFVLIAFVLYCYKHKYKGLIIISVIYLIALVIILGQEWFL